ncbi:MAG: hypothetical protein EXX96DRAFT_574055 [Benjaminiella poitrasii]|nr:MAG: hypothetical protein EXX96DRAFT_574055 [Benjaminiella poitrasii]
MRGTVIFTIAIVSSLVNFTYAGSVSSLNTEPVIQGIDPAVGRVFHAGSDVVGAAGDALKSSTSSSGTNAHEIVHQKRKKKRDGVDGNILGSLGSPVTDGLLKGIIGSVRPVASTSAKGIEQGVNEADVAGDSSKALGKRDGSPLDDPALRGLLGRLGPKPLDSVPGSDVVQSVPGLNSLSGFVGFTGLTGRPLGSPNDKPSSRPSVPPSGTTGPIPPPAPPGPSKRDTIDTTTSSVHGSTIASVADNVLNKAPIADAASVVFRKRFSLRRRGAQLPKAVSSMGKDILEYDTAKVKDAVKGTIH